MIRLRTQLGEDGKPPLTTVSRWDEFYEAYRDDAFAAHALLRAIAFVAGQRGDADLVRQIEERATVIHQEMMGKSP